MLAYVLIPDLGVLHTLLDLRHAWKGRGVQESTVGRVLSEVQRDVKSLLKSNREKQSAAPAACTSAFLKRRLQESTPGRGAVSRHKVLPRASWGGRHAHS